MPPSAGLRRPGAAFPKPGVEGLRLQLLLALAAAKVATGVRPAKPLEHLRLVAGPGTSSFSTCPPSAGRWPTLARSDKALLRAGPQKDPSRTGIKVGEAIKSVSDLGITVSQGEALTRLEAERSVLGISSQKDPSVPK